MLTYLLPLFAAIHPLTPDLPPAETPKVVDNPLQTLDTLITATEQTLADQKALRQRLIEYCQLKAQYLQDPHNREQMTRLVRAAPLILEAIQTYHLSDAFDPDWLEELGFFSQIATKKTRS